MLRSFPISYQRDPIKTSILLAVSFIHLFFLLWMIIPHSRIHPKKALRPMIVKTIEPKSAVRASDKPKAAAHAAPSVPLNPPRPIPKAPAQKAQTPPVAKKPQETKKTPPIQDKVVKNSKPSPPKKAQASEPRAKISEDLYRELEESIAKIDAKRDKLYPEKFPAAKMFSTPLHIDAAAGDLSSSNGSYAEALVHYLHQSLHLPEYGEVKVELTLRQDGSVAKMVVLKAESSHNRKYLEAHLPKLRFPKFEGQLATSREHTFALTFCNELN